MGRRLDVRPVVSYCEAGGPGAEGVYCGGEGGVVGEAEGGVGGEDLVGGGERRDCHVVRGRW